MATLISSIVVFLLVVLLHEFGHFFVAKKVGIRVNEFSIGMGPKIYQKKKGETMYSLRALPIGGYCAMEGENGESQDPRSFEKATIGSRALVVVAGAAMNFILALVAFFLALLLMGTPTNTINQTVDHYPAMEAGLKAGDQIVAVNGFKVDSGRQVTEEISRAKSVDLTYKRDGQIRKTKLETKTENNRQVVGITFQNQHNPLEALKGSFSMTLGVVVGIFGVFKMIFSGSFQTQMLAGPVGVIQVIGQSAAMGLGSLLYILGIISANLGVVNLLPIPALDGGKLVFLLIEAVRGKPVDGNKEALITIAGMVLLFGLMLYITIFSDLKRIF